MENEIKTFLTRISKYCETAYCEDCPFYEDEYDTCVFREYHPFEWVVDELLERYNNVKDGDAD